MSDFIDLSICTDCLMAAVNDEWPEDEARATEVREGFAELAREGMSAPIHNGDDEHFSWSPCDCCRTSLGGERHDAVSFPFTTLA